MCSALSAPSRSCRRPSSRPRLEDEALDRRSLFLPVEGQRFQRRPAHEQRELPALEQRAQQEEAGLVDQMQVVDDHDQRTLGRRHGARSGPGRRRSVAAWLLRRAAGAAVPSPTCGTM